MEPASAAIASPPDNTTTVVAIATTFLRISIPSVSLERLAPPCRALFSDLRARFEGPPGFRGILLVFSRLGPRRERRDPPLPGARDYDPDLLDSKYVEEIAGSVGDIE